MTGADCLKTGDPLGNCTSCRFRHTIPMSVVETGFVRTRFWTAWEMVTGLVDEFGEEEDNSVKELLTVGGICK